MFTSQTRVVQLWHSVYRTELNVEAKFVCVKKDLGNQMRDDNTYNKVVSTRILVYPADN